MSRALLIKEMPYAERPRERLMERGADALRNAELIAILLRTGMKGVSAIQVAEQLLTKSSTLDNLSRASIPELRQIKGIGRDKAIALQSAFTLARRMAQEIRQESPTLDTPERIADLLREENRVLEVENFQVLLLNTRRKLIQKERSEEHTSELQSQSNLVCRLLLEKKNNTLSIYRFKALYANPNALHDSFRDRGRTILDAEARNANSSLADSYHTTCCPSSCAAKGR